MLFFGPPIAAPTTNVQLLAAASGGWNRQGGNLSSLECRVSSSSTASYRGIKGIECRPYIAPGAPPDKSGVVTLQKALKTLATATGQAKFDPGTVDGTVGPNTRMALANALPSAANYIDGDLKYPALALAAIVLTGKGDAQIVSLAQPLAIAISIYTMQAAGATPDVGAGGGGAYPDTSGGTPWYSQTSGKVAIGIGAALVLLLVLRK